jgi:hypothetical protein
MKRKITTENQARVYDSPLVYRSFTVKVKAIVKVRRVQT